jgi:hypothetical protein
MVSALYQRAMPKGYVATVWKMTEELWCVFIISVVEQLKSFCVDEIRNGRTDNTWQERAQLSTLEIERNSRKYEMEVAEGDRAN